MTEKIDEKEVAGLTGTMDRRRALVLADRLLELILESEDRLQPLVPEEESVEHRVGRTKEVVTTSQLTVEAEERFEQVGDGFETVF